MHSDDNKNNIVHKGFTMMILYMRVNDDIYGSAWSLFVHNNDDNTNDYVDSDDSDDDYDDD